MEVTLESMGKLAIKCRTFPVFSGRATMSNAILIPYFSNAMESAVARGDACAAHTALAYLFVLYERVAIVTSDLRELTHLRELLTPSTIETLLGTGRLIFFFEPDFYVTCFPSRIKQNMKWGLGETEYAEPGSCFHFGYTGSRTLEEMRHAFSNSPQNDMLDSLGLMCTSAPLEPDEPDYGAITVERWKQYDRYLKAARLSKYDWQPSSTDSFWWCLAFEVVKQRAHYIRDICLADHVGADLDFGYHSHWHALRLENPLANHKPIKYRKELSRLRRLTGFPDLYRVLFRNPSSLDTIVARTCSTAGNEFRDWFHCTIDSAEEVRIDAEYTKKLSSALNTDSPICAWIWWSIQNALSLIPYVGNALDAAIGAAEIIRKSAQPKWGPCLFLERALDGIEDNG